MHSRFSMTLLMTLLSTIPIAGLSNDPVGDQFRSSSQPDLIALSPRVVADELVVELLFDGNAPAAPSNDESWLAGFLDLDIDRDASTGARSAIDFSTTNRPQLHNGLGVDLQVDFASWADGTMDLRDQQTGRILERVSATVIDRGIEVRIPIHILGTSEVYMAALIGDRSEPSDSAPNGGYVTTASTGGVPLQDGRFRVEVTWQDFSGSSGTGTVVTSSTDSALFWFFDAANWELLLKVLDGCGINERFWVYLAATTNVAFTVSITDTVSGTVRLYENPLGNAAAAINDIEAFATCSR